MSSFDRKGYFPELEGGSSLSHMTPEQLRAREQYLIEANRNRYEQLERDRREREAAEMQSVTSWTDPILQGVQRLGAVGVLPFSVDNAMSRGQSFGQAVRGTSERFMEDPGSFTFREATDGLGIPQWASNVAGTVADFFAPGPGELIQGINAASRLGEAASAVGGVTGAGIIANRGIASTTKEFTDELLRARAEYGEEGAKQVIADFGRDLIEDNPDMLSLPVVIDKVQNLDDAGLGRFTNSMTGVQTNAEEIASSLQAGGFTYDFDRGIVPMIRAYTPSNSTAKGANVYGYAVGAYPQLGVIVPVTEFPLSDPQALAQLMTQFIAERAPILRRPRHAIGGWVDDGTFYLDLSIITRDKDKALDIGRAADQKAVAEFHAADEPFLSSGGSGKVPDPLPEEYLESFTQGGRFVPGTLINVPAALSSQLKRAEEFYRRELLPIIGSPRNPNTTLPPIIYGKPGEAAPIPPEPLSAREVARANRMSALGRGPNYTEERARHAARAKQIEEERRGRRR